MTTVKPTPDYAAIMRAKPSERDQKAMDVLSQVLRDLRASSLAFFPAQGTPRDLGPPKEEDGIGKGLAQANAANQTAASAATTNVSSNQPWRWAAGSAAAGRCVASFMGACPSSLGRPRSPR